MRKAKDILRVGAMGASTLFTCALAAFLMGYVLLKGLPRHLTCLLQECCPPLPSCF